jgi:putative colanic acid biosysnthesis UDP-glucose lipid carrier transferase
MRVLHPRANFDYRLTHTPLGGAAKRALDIIAAASLLAILSPMLLLVGALVRLDSPGPALFRQARTGFRGRSFDICKFRTMRSAPVTGDIEQAVRGDARVTRLGQTLRRYSVDELPQLLNVLAGDMSLVGPRPHAVVHDYAFAGVDPSYSRRFFARPGITGLAQVSGSRGQSETPEKIRTRIAKDLDYIDNWSTMNDLAIMVATVRVVFHDPNAY